MAEDNSPKHQTPERDGAHARYSDQDLAYMRSLGAAVAQRSPKASLILLFIIAFAIFSLILWMAWAEIDVVVRGEGKVIPSSQLQVIQSLEGGVIAEILVDEGDIIDQGQPLMRISDISYASSYEENRLRYLELRARIARLEAQANQIPFVDDEEVANEMPELLLAERDLYDSQQEEYRKKLGVLEEQLVQSRNELIEAQARKRQLTANAQLIRDEITIKKPLVDSGLISEVEFIQLRRQATEIEGDLENISLSIPRIKSRIQEAERTLEQAGLELANAAREQLNETLAEASRLLELSHAIRDRVVRSTLRSPVHGTVKRMHVNTIGGVIRPGEPVVEVVPLEDALLIEARIQPADIANVSVGLPARVKFSAYDFAIHGSLAGKVSFVSADSITTDEGVSYFLVRLKPEKSFLGYESAPLPIMVGMTCQVDILTDKRSILEYILKPIHRGMKNAMGER